MVYEGQPLVRPDEIEGGGVRVFARFDEIESFAYALEHDERRKADPSQLAEAVGTSCIRRESRSVVTPRR